MINSDQHIHTLLSPDGHMDIAEAVQRAVDLSLSHIAITEHYEFYQNRSDNRYFHREYIDEHLRRIEAIRAEYGDRIEIAFGIEIGQPHIDWNESQDIVRSYPFDFIIASYHKVNGIDLSRYDYSHSINLLDMYLDGLDEISQTCDFDVLGHIDLPRRYSSRQGFPVEAESRMDKVERILKAVIYRGKGIEVNTSTMREGKAPMPGAAILSLYKKLGGSIITAGSDAHRAEDIAMPFGEAECVIRAAGFNAVSVFMGRKARQAAMEGDPDA